MYECGFKNTTKNNINIRFNSMISCIFLLLYEIEFIFMVPAAFYQNFIKITSVAIFLLMVSIVTTFLLDVYTQSVK